jgi:hypothetical protein
VLAVVAGSAEGTLNAHKPAEIGVELRRPFRHAKAAVASGEAELAALQPALADQRRAMALVEVMVACAEAGFGQVLAAGWQCS